MGKAERGRGNVGVSLGLDDRHAGLEGGLEGECAQSRAGSECLQSFALSSWLCAYASAFPTPRTQPNRYPSTPSCKSSPPQQDVYSKH